MKRVAVALLVLSFCSVAFSASQEAELLNATFDNADITAWRTAGDLCVAPAFCAGTPSGQYWIAMSTNNSGSDSLTMCGFSSVGGVQSVLRSPDLVVPFRPNRI